MTEPTPYSKENPGPFDAVQTAKPGEPIFTLQGGDPLAPPLVLQWAHDARKLGIELLASDEKGKRSKGEALLLKATEAENVAWTMDEYRKGDLAAPEPEEAEDPDLDVRARMDEHSERLAAMRKVENARAELVEAAEVAEKYDLPRTANELRGFAALAAHLSKALQGSARLG